jgi:aryl-alcohol dehydrogenase-like predicted oxidoreductase
MLGEAIAPYRPSIFLASKTLQRDSKGARRELEESLRSLRTERLDLYQFHSLNEPEEVERLLAPGGAVEGVARAREEGKVRYIGCSAHTVPAALMMLESFPLDSIVFPINYVCYSRGDFGAAVLRRAAQLGVARLAVKAMALTRRGRRRDAYPNCWYQPIEDRALAEQALRFALAEDVTAALTPADASLFRLSLELAYKYEPLDSAARRELLEQGRRIRPFMPLH